ncbi:MAG: PilW family protein [Candidatus Aquicultor sp.]
MMVRLIAIIKNEKGTTLAELIIYAVILVVILVASYTIYQGSEAIYTSSSGQADAQRTARLAQAQMTKNIRMTESLVTADDTSISLRADIDDDNMWETVDFYTQNGSLYAKIDNGTAKEIATGVQNDALDMPLFTYYNIHFVPITTDTASRKTKSYQIEVNLIIDTDVNRPPDAYTLTSKVMLRNRE